MPNRSSQGAGLRDQQTAEKVQGPARLIPRHSIMLRRTKSSWSRRRFGAFLFTTLLSPAFANSANPVFETFDSGAQKRWKFFADTVMGGVSSGEVTFKREGSHSFARMTGQVSTANNGGFIQFRRDFRGELPSGISGISLIVRGNSQRYFIHLRTRGTFLPWQYYQAGFETSYRWSEVFLPLDSFRPSGSFMRASPTAGSLRSIGVVAFGRDHEAQIDVSQINFY